MLALLWSLARADDVTDLDDPVPKKHAVRQPGHEVIREVVRGFYAKADVGTTIYLGTFASTLSAGTVMSLGVGQDFLDQEHASMAWEAVLYQGVHNGLLFQLQPGNVPPSAYIQGDTRTFELLGNWEYSLYPTRRLGVGVRVGGGIGAAPLLMERGAYVDKVVNETWQCPAGCDGEPEPQIHVRPYPLVFGGPTFEYYTKLSHFSVGVDADVSYGFGFDLGMSIQGFMKYTFAHRDRRAR
jgi:hypothetical protein